MRTRMEFDTMNRSAFVIVTTALLLFGCNKPSPVELQQNEEDALLEVSSVVSTDSSFGLASIDSSVAVLPQDQGRFACLLQVARFQFDTGQGVVPTVAFAHVLVEDRNRPVLIGNRIIGYYGMNLGFVTVRTNQNTDLMIPVAHRPGRRDTAGVEYYADLTPSYRPTSRYTFRAFPDSLDFFPASIETPEDLTVLSPRGGATIRRDRDLALVWTGHGRLSFVISELLLLGKARPILAVKVKNNIQHAVLSAKILAMLPSRRRFVFTFVLENRLETVTAARFSGRVLVQATSVYNSYVDLI